MRMLLSIAIMGLVTAGCYEVPQDRLIDGMDESNSYGQMQCESGLRTGCLKGNIISAPQIFVNNRKFEDSEDFALMFSELVTVENKEGLALAKDDYSVELLTPISNRQFSQDFEVYVRGQDARSTEALRDGTFYLNHLQPGLYDVRAQRRLIFKVSRDEIRDADSEEVLQEKVEKFYCATLKAEQTVQVYAGEKLNPIFEEFDLFWREKGCSAEELEFGVVTL